MEKLFQIDGDASVTSKLIAEWKRISGVIQKGGHCGNVCQLTAKVTKTGGTAPLGEYSPKRADQQPVTRKKTGLTAAKKEQQSVGAESSGRILARRTGLLPVT